MIKVSGRRLVEAMCAVTVVDGHILIRIDDRKRPAFWIEVELDREEWDRVSTEMIEQMDTAEEVKATEPEQQ